MQQALYQQIYKNSGLTRNQLIENHPTNMQRSSKSKPKNSAVAPGSASQTHRGGGIGGLTSYSSLTGPLKPVLPSRQPGINNRMATGLGGVHGGSLNSNYNNKNETSKSQVFGTLKKQNSTDTFKNLRSQAIIQGKSMSSSKKIQSSTKSGLARTPNRTSMAYFTNKNLNLHGAPDTDRGPKTAEKMIDQKKNNKRKMNKSIISQQVFLASPRSSKQTLGKQYEEDYKLQNEGSIDVPSELNITDPNNSHSTPNLTLLKVSGPGKKREQRKSRQQRMNKDGTAKKTRGRFIEAIDSVGNLAHKRSTESIAEISPILEKSKSPIKKDEAENDQEMKAYDLSFGSLELREESQDNKKNNAQSDEDDNQEISEPDGAGKIKPRGDMLAIRENEPPTDLARKRDLPYLCIDPNESLDEEDVAPNAKIQLYQTYGSPLHRPQKSNTFETLQTKVIRAASNNSGRLLETKEGQEYLRSIADDARKNKTAEKSRLFQNNKTNRDRQSNPIGNQITELKLQQKMYSFTKQNSPKRPGGAGQSFNAANHVKKAQVSLERKDNRGSLKSDMRKPLGGSKELQGFSTALSNRKSEVVEVSSHSFPYLRRDLNQKDSQDQLATQNQDSRLASRPAGDANKTPGKFKKSTYLNSYKKGGNVQNLASAKQMLNQSMTSVNSGKNQQMHAQSRTNNTLSHNTPNNIQSKAALTTGGMRTGIHQDPVAEDTGPMTVGIALPESRQMVNSPFKARPKNVEGQQNYAQMTVSLAAKQATLTAKKAPPASRMGAVGNKTKNDRSQQRGSYQVNSAIRNRGAQQRQTSTQKDREDAYGAARVFNSKSPSKKSLQLQQILKSINLQTSSSNQKKRTVAATQNTSTDHKNSTSKSSSLIRNFIHQVSQPSNHAHTKSYRALAAGGSGSMNPTYQGSNQTQHKSSTAFGHQSTSVTSAAGLIAKSQVNTASGSSFRNSHVNPYIQSKGKSKPKDVSNTVARGFARRAERDLEKEEAGAPLSDRAGTGLAQHTLTQHYLGGVTEDRSKKSDIGDGTSMLLDKKAATALSQSLKQNTLANNVNRNVGKVLTASKKLIQSKASGKPIYSPAGTGQMKVTTSVTERSDQTGNQGTGQSAVQSQRRKKNDRLHPEKAERGGFHLADTSNNYLKLGTKNNEPHNRHAFTSGVATKNMSSSVVVTNTSDISEENQESDEREESTDRNVNSVVMENLELLKDDDEEPDSAENINEVHIHQSSQIKTPKQISDMSAGKKNVIKSSTKAKPAYVGSASKTGFSNQGSQSASKKQIIGDMPKSGTTRNVNTQKKETKYAAISFNDSAQGDDGGESGQKVNLNLNDQSNVNSSTIGIYKSQRSQKQQQNNIAYENPYRDEFVEEDQVEDGASPTETASKEHLAEPNTALASDRQEWQGLNSPAPQSIHTDNIGVASPQSHHQSRSSRVINESTWTNNVDEPCFPISAAEFLEQYQDCMLEEEIKELGTGEGQFDTVYYAGSISGRSREDLEICQTLNEERRKTFEEMKANAEDTGNGEFQGNPIFDNHEGYYKVQIGEHIAYRYEILKVLGKGSFAQVVQCRDHKDPNQAIYAVKITRNTEMDHKFAHKEAQYLRYIMQEDPHDKHNIVRMLDQCYFRDHHCFVFELLHTDLFEHLKATGFVGFSTDKIRDYAFQILQGLVFLEKHKIIHCDLKPENILCVDTMCRNLKVVDFGSGCFRDEQIYTYVQSRFYRSPEVILRVKYSEKVDIWSLGCILAELYTGEPLFPGNNEQEQLELIMELCGMPPETMIDKSRKKDHYFDTDYSPFLIEDERLGILRIPSSRPLREAVPCEDNQFLDFVLQCLEIDPETRFSASEAMEHPWIKAAQEEKLNKKNNHFSDARSAPTKPGKRMGQNESAEELYQPQILREKEVREREGEECPTEYSPEREIIAQRKKPSQKINKESFGIKLNNLNIAPTDGKSAKKPNNKSGTEVRVSDFIAEQKNAGHYNSQLPGDNDVMQNSIAQSSGKKIAQGRNSSDNVSNISSVKNSSQNSNGALKQSQISLIVDKDSSVMQQPQALYYSGTNKHDQNRVSNAASQKSKSIIPDIDYTNKYVRRQKDLINSRSDGQGENSFVADEINDVSQELGKEDESSKQIGGPQDPNQASQSSLEQIQAGHPQQTNFQQEPRSPFKSKFSNKFNMMEQIAQFEHDGDTTVMSQSYMGRNSQYDMASQIGSIYPYKKKKPVTNNFMQPSQ